MKPGRDYILFIIKFLGTFCIFYFGTLAVIGLSAPGGYYSPFIAKYLDYIDWMRASLLYGSGFFLGLIGYDTYTPDKYHIFIVNGTGVRMVYSCIGYGVMSFWAAFVIANKGNWIKKIKWLLSGWIAIWIINVLRISFLVLALNKGWDMPLNIDHHTWFNIAAYILIFVLIYFYDRSSKIIKKGTGYSKTDT
jgi:exosortase/archaeosortase family protein